MFYNDNMNNNVASFCYVIVALAASVVATAVPKECDKLGLLFYEELGCKPIYGDGKCPQRYECEDNKLKTDNCKFGGRVYKSGEEIDDELPYKTCYAACSCRGSSGIECASVDCPEHFNGPTWNETCYHTYDLGKCCSTGLKCVKDDPITCTYNGRTYKEGQRVHVKDACYECVCRKGFDGQLARPHCERLRCNVEISHPQEVANECAPIYSEGFCCPYGYACPSNDEVIIKGKRETAAKCKYGDKLLNVGDAFKKVATTFDGTRERHCECRLPPLVSCFDRRESI